MDSAKRASLIERLSRQPEPQLVAVDVFFDGNDDVGSIGCNLATHPGIDVFRATFARVAQRSDVLSIYAQIAELDPGGGCWPFSDTIFVVGSIPADDLRRELAPLEPDEVGSAPDFRVPQALLDGGSAPVLAVWWD